MQRVASQCRIRNFRRAISGSAAAEFVLILPLLVLFLIAAIELGRAVRDYHVITESVRDAARFLARAEMTCSAPNAVCGSMFNFCTGATCGNCIFASVSDVDAAVTLAMTGDTAGADNLLGYFSDTSDVVIEVCTIDNTALPAPFQGAYAGSPIVPHIKLSATVSFDFLFGDLVMPGSNVNFDVSHNTVHLGL